MRSKGNDMTKKKTTLKEKLTAYFALVMGIAVLLSVFSLLFCMIYNYRNVQLNSQLTMLHAYYDQLESCQDYLGRYVRYEEEAYFQTVTEQMNGLDGLIPSVSRTVDLEFCREIQDVSLMTKTLVERVNAIREQMLAYQAAGRAEFAPVNEAHLVAKTVFSAIQGEYSTLTRMILEMIDRSYQTMERQIRIFMLLLAAVIAMVGVLMRVNTRRLSRAISVPIGALTDAARKIREGDVEQVALMKDVATDDEEMQMLLSVFDEMTGGVKTQIKTLQENVRIRQELEESRLKELQMQINPHFMFNTLNMISETAYLENAEKTVFLLEKTAKMYRFSLDFSGKPVPLSREIEALGNYVIVQEERFGDRFRFLFDLDERFHHIMIPALTLQPLVENAIIHGVGMKMEEGYVLVQTKYDEAAHIGRIVVEDNGEGMDETALIALRESIQDGGGSVFKIGLNNVMRRLKLQYGERASMQIDSSRGNGMRIVIEIRLSEEETRCIG